MENMRPASKIKSKSAIFLKATLAETMPEYSVSLDSLSTGKALISSSLLTGLELSLSSTLILILHSPNISHSSTSSCLGHNVLIVQDILSPSMAPADNFVLMDTFPLEKMCVLIAVRVIIGMDLLV